MPALKHPSRVTPSQAMMLRWLNERGSASPQCLVRYALGSMHALWRRDLVTVTRGGSGEFVVTDKGRQWLAEHPVKGAA